MKYKALEVLHGPDLCVHASSLTSVASTVQILIGTIRVASTNNKPVC